MVVAAGVGPASGSEAWEAELGWWGVQMEAFFRYCQRLTAGTDLDSAMVGYGEWIKGQVPPWPEWRLNQAREALRCFKKGTVNFALVDEVGGVAVKYDIMAEGEGVVAEPGAGEGDAVAGGSASQKVRRIYLATGEVNWLRTMEELMMVRRYALRTRETYLGWARRYLEWTVAKAKAAETVGAVQWFLTEQVAERKISASTQNHALSAVLFLVQEVMEVPVEGVDAVRAKRSKHLPVVLSKDAVRRGQEYRFRYLLRTTVPLSDDKKWYLALWNEVFINFGGNLEHNHFDQNRAFIGLGRKVSDSTKLEVGFLEQTLQRRGGVNWEHNHTVALWLTSHWALWMR
jgi:Protein of unknown function (DUF2490)/Phage integrase, N-terminal SAM-like domain